MIRDDGDECDYDECNKRLDIVCGFGQKLIALFQQLNYGNNSFTKNPLVFKFHVKSCHYYFKSKCKMGTESDRFIKLGNMIQNMTIKLFIDISNWSDTI